MLVRALLDNIQAALDADSTTLAPTHLWVGLFTGITDRGVDTVLADLTQATGDASVRVNVAAWSAPYHLADGSPAQDGPECRFQLGGSDSAITAIGYFIGDASVAGNLRAFDYILPPIPMPDQFTPVVVVPRVAIPVVGRWLLSEVWDS